MKAVQVKICGITSRRDLEVVVEAGADAVGFVVGSPRSPRNVTLEMARRLIRLTPAYVEPVAVTVERDPLLLKKMVSYLGVPALQVHVTREPEALRRALPGIRLIRALSIGHQFADGVGCEVSHFDAVLLDSSGGNGYGGTGIVHDWRASRRIRDLLYPKQVIVAGGLRPENVSECIRTVRPYGVDVSSGVELRPGIKDPKKVRQFVRAAREAED